MGYYTYYDLSIDEGSNEEQAKAESDINALKGANSFIWEAYHEGVHAKWYDHDEEIIEFSKLHPNIVFSLEGDGEETGDQWFKYYKNGKYQYDPAQIIFEGYHPSLLTDYKE